MVTIPIEKAVEIALEQHQAGNFVRAEALYIEILRQDPGNVDAMHLLGVLATQGHKPEVAVQLISAALRKRPDAAIFHYNLAEAHSALGEARKAASAYQRAVELDPEYIEAHSNLANVLNQLGDFAAAEIAVRRAIELDDTGAKPFNVLGDALRGQNRAEDAIESYERAIQLDPKFATGHNNLAGVLRSVSRFDDSVRAYRAAVQLEPASADLHNNLGAVLAQMGRNEEAGAEFQIAIDLKPDHLEAINNLGAALKTLGQHTAAEPFFREAIKLNAASVEPHLNLASILLDTRRYEEALQSIDAAVELRPELAACHFFRGIILRDLQRFDDAVDSLRRAQNLAPQDPGTLTALGYALLERGDLEEAMDNLRRSIELKPSPRAHSNVLLTMNYHPGFAPAELLTAHQSWAELHEKPHRDKWLPHANDRSPERKLKIGYVSPDFRGHSVSYFLEPLLRYHDRDQFEIIGFAHLIEPDAHTWRLRAQVDRWRETAGKNFDEVAAMIRDDQIDILVELAGHTANNGLPIFARRPAPVQINLIGFPSTTGLSAMDYRVTDARCDPIGVTDAYNTESLIRLPDLFWAYLPAENAPPVGPLPADANDGRITFASVNNFAKVTPPVQHLWAQLLHAIPNSQLILQTTAVSSLHTQRLVKERFAAVGVSSDRLDFRPWSDFVQYMQLLTESDMTLDPFPFNGGTTTCHSLWMGAPVITLAGDRHASRMGLSMMTAIGLPEFIAHTPEEYVQIGVRMANDLPRLREIRRGMRERLAASPLLDGATYTRNLEAAYRQVWRKWCESAAT